MVFEDEEFLPKTTRRRIPYSEIESRVLKMRLPNSRFLFLKQNIATACFAIIQSPYKIDPQFVSGFNPQCFNREACVYINHDGKVFAMRITNDFGDGMLIYEQICDALGLEESRSYEMPM